MPGKGRTGESGHKETDRVARHTGCRVCSWRVSLCLGLGSDAGLPPCRITGLDWHCHLSL